MGRGKKCRCKNGKYSTRCCSSSKSSTKRRRTRKQQSPLEAPFTPREFMERRARTKAVTYVIMNPYVRRGAEYLLYHVDRSILRRMGVREVGTTTRVLYGTTRVAGRVASKAVPIVGWVSLGYDAVQFGRWVRDRRQ